jgi:site-specific recombinase XerD
MNQNKRATLKGTVPPATPKRKVREVTPEQLHTLLRRFLTAKQAANRAATTVNWYDAQISGFLLWLDAPEVASDELPALIDGYLASERERGVKPSSVAARYRALSAWLNWCSRRKLIDRNPIPELDKPSVPKEQAQHVTLNECNALLESITANEWTDQRDRLILTLLFWSGLRAAELTGLYVTDVDTRAGTVLVRHGKGQKARVVPTAPTVGALLLGYLYSRPAYTGPELLLSADGANGVRGPLTTDGLRQVLKRLCKRAGVPYLHPHAWRHGFAMLFLNEGANLSAVSAMMGHSSTTVTQTVYASWQTRGLLREYGETFSRIQGHTD